MRARRHYSAKRILGVTARLVLALVLLIVLTPAGVALADTIRTIKVEARDDDEAALGCTLREAIDLANNSAPAGPAPNQCIVDEVILGLPIPIRYVIDLPSYTYTLTGAAGEDSNGTGDLDIFARVTINGNGPHNTIISGGSLDRVFDIDPGNQGEFAVAFNRVAITKGGIAGWGGAIHIGDDQVVINRCALTDSSSGGMVAGGAIYNGSGALTVIRSTLSGNSSDNGGAIYSAGTLTMINSTLSGNTVIYHGGGLYVGGGTADLSNVTITGNTADSDEDTIGNGGGIYHSGGVVHLKNTIVASNWDADPGPGDVHPDLSGVIDGDARNLIGDATGCTGTAGTGTDIVDPVPGLGPLGDNGGDTSTHAIDLRSPAYNAVLDCTDLGGNPVNLDQRGVPRPQSLACDIGAYEYLPYVFYLPIVQRSLELED